MEFSASENLLKEVLCVLSETATRGPRMPGVSLALLREQTMNPTQSPTYWKKNLYLFKQTTECYFIVFPLCERIENSSWEAQRAQKYMDLSDNKSIINMQTLSLCETV